MWSNIYYDYCGVDMIGKCPYCGEEGELEKVYSMTQYVKADGKQNEVANAVPDLCHECAEDYYNYWRDAWATYYREVI